MLRHKHKVADDADDEDAGKTPNAAAPLPPRTVLLPRPNTHAAAALLAWLAKHVQHHTALPFVRGDDVGRGAACVVFSAFEAPHDASGTGPLAARTAPVPSTAPVPFTAPVARTSALAPARTPLRTPTGAVAVVKWSPLWEQAVFVIAPQHAPQHALAASDDDGAWVRTCGSLPPPLNRGVLRADVRELHVCPRDAREALTAARRAPWPYMPAYRDCSVQPATWMLSAEDTPTAEQANAPVPATTTFVQLTQFWVQAALGCLVDEWLVPRCAHFLAGDTCARLVPLPPARPCRRRRGGGGGTGAAGLAGVTVMERVDATLDHVLPRVHGAAMRSIMFQLLVALHAGQTLIGLKHHDAHSRNVFLRVLDPTWLSRDLDRSDRVRERRRVQGRGDGHGHGHARVAQPHAHRDSSPRPDPVHAAAAAAEAAGAAADAFAYTLLQPHAAHARAPGTADVPPPSRPRVFVVPHQGLLVKLGDWDLGSAHHPLHGGPDVRIMRSDLTLLESEGDAVDDDRSGSTDDSSASDRDASAGRATVPAAAASSNGAGGAAPATPGAWGPWNGHLVGHHGYDAQFFVGSCLVSKALTPAARKFLQQVQARLGGADAVSQTQGRPLEGRVSDLPPLALLLDPELFGQWEVDSSAAAAGVQVGFTETERDAAGIVGHAA